MSEELNCSEGARMLIDRMQTHPQEFKRNGRFSRIVDQILGNVPAGFCELSDRDDDALTAAFEKYIMEPSLTEYVVDEIFNGEKRRKEEQEMQQQEVQARYSRSLAANMAATQHTITSNLLAAGINNSQALMQNKAHPLQNSTTAIQPGMITHVQSQSQAWFEEERKRLREATERTLKKLKRDKSK
jgi:aspartate/methionine/tyrosine aminotransferase